jgi:hypothetical protein
MDPQLDLVATSGDRVHGLTPPRAIGLNAKGRVINVSPSSMQLWWGCRQRWWYKEVEGLPDPMNIHGANGKATHDAIAALHKSRLEGKPLITREVIDLYRERFRQMQGAVVDQDDDGPEWLKVDRVKLGRLTAQAIELYCREHAPAVTPHLVETRIEVQLEVGDIQVLAIGRADLIDDRGIVHDFKVRTRVPYWDEINEADEAQLLWYGMLMEQLEGRVPPLYQFEYLVASDKGVQVLPLTVTAGPEKYERLRNLVGAAVEEMVEGRVVPNPSYSLCNPRQCPFWVRCHEDW